MTALLVLLVFGIVCLAAATALVVLVFRNEIEGATAELHDEEPVFHMGKDSDYLG